MFQYLFLGFFSSYQLNLRRCRKFYNDSVKSNNWKARQKYKLDILWLEAIKSIKTRHITNSLYGGDRNNVVSEKIKIISGIKNLELFVPIDLNFQNEEHKTFVSLVIKELYKLHHANINEECLPIPYSFISNNSNFTSLRDFLGNANLIIIPATKIESESICVDLKSKIKLRNIYISITSIIIVLAICSFPTILLLMFFYINELYLNELGVIFGFLVIIALIIFIVQIGKYFVTKYPFLSSYYDTRDLIANKIYNIRNQSINIRCLCTKISKNNLVQFTNEPLGIKISKNKIAVFGSVTFEFSVKTVTYDGSQREWLYTNDKEHDKLYLSYYGIKIFSKSNYLDYCFVSDYIITEIS